MSAAFILQLCLGTLAASPVDDFKTANKLYDDGKFVEAIAIYQKIEPKYSNVFYNLGNACFRANQLGRAILNYERARRLCPRDPDILANLSFAQERLAVGAVNVPPGPFERFFERIVFRATVNEWSAQELVAAWSLALALSLAVCTPQVRKLFLCLAIAALLWLLGCASAIASHQATVRRAPTAVVIQHNSEARFAPLADATVHFKLLEGTKVIVREDRGQWLFVERADKQQGWLQKDAVELVGSY